MKTIGIKRFLLAIIFSTSMLQADQQLQQDLFNLQKQLEGLQTQLDKLPETQQSAQKEKERQEQERRQKEQQERLERERQEQERKRREQQELEQKRKEEQERKQRDQERLEQERQRQEQERKQKEEQERLEKERRQKEQQEEERKHKEQEQQQQKIKSEKQAVVFAYPKFSEWFKACEEELPYYRTEGQAFNKPAKLTADEVIIAVNAFIDVMQTQLQQKLWVGGNEPGNEFFTNPTFRPYAQKLSLPPGTEVAFHGDLHGDVHSLVKYLEELRKNNYLNDGFTIKKDNFYIVFLGDYTDRGNYGTEVIYTLLRLKIANPDKVFLARGNHEDVAITARYGFQDELKKKFPEKNIKEKIKWTENKDIEIPVNLVNKEIAKIYELMPVVIYVGSPTDYLQCNHGGMELGYLPQALLDSKIEPIAYQWLPSELKRGDNFASMPNKDSYKDHDVNFKNITLISPMNPHTLGFMWNDFIVQDNLEFWNNSRRGAYTFGKNFTKDILGHSSSKNSKVIGVFRAHQHDDNLNDMMNLIVYGNEFGRTPGVGKLWQSKATQNHEIWPGIVATFNVSPDSNFGKGLNYNFDTYGMLTIGKTFPKDWKFQVISHVVVK
ncbi:MAG: metallophosphoesterase [Candidatus Babeliales bacterium]